jgi:hypothetical protein
MVPSATTTPPRRVAKSVAGTAPIRRSGHEGTVHHSDHPLAGQSLKLKPHLAQRAAAAMPDAGCSLTTTSGVRRSITRSVAGSLISREVDTEAVLLVPPELLLKGSTVSHVAEHGSDEAPGLNSSDLSFIVLVVEAARVSEMVTSTASSRSRHGDVDLGNVKRPLNVNAGRLLMRLSHLRSRPCMPVFR